MIELLHIDCMEYMRTLEDKAFDLAIVDPPYRDNKDNQPTKEMRNKIGGNMKKWEDKPTPEYFKELMRVSKNQIIWGANNFIENLYSTNCFLFWYKNNPMDNYSDGEIAWTSFDKVARCIPINHFGAHTRDKIKIHPTQKPVDLYKWCFDKYAKHNCNIKHTKEYNHCCTICREPFKILDTHLGSGSSAIAAHNMGLDFVGTEIDADYYAAACKRFKEQTMQLSLL